MKTLIRITLGMLMALVTACTMAPASNADLVPMPGSTTGAQAYASLYDSRPKSAAAYKYMFDKIDPCIWGYSDGAESVVIPDGRVIWLFGDTVKECSGVSSFVGSSSGIVQRGSYARAVNSGRQILPNGPLREDGRKTVYWIEEAVYAGPAKDGGYVLDITAAEMALGVGFNFDRIGCQSRAARVKVDSYSNLKFLYWRSYVPVPNQYDDWHAIAPGHTGGIVRAHYWAKLSSGKTLTTTSHWYDGTYAGPTPTTRDKRPFFTEGTGIEKKATYKDWLTGKAALGDAGSAAKLAECFPG